MVPLKEKEYFRITRGFVELMILQFLESEAMSTCQIALRFSRIFMVHLGFNKVSSVLESLEKKGYISGEIKYVVQRQTRIYYLTQKGRNILGHASGSVDFEFAYVLLPEAMELVHR